MLPKLQARAREEAQTQNTATLAVRRPCVSSRGEIHAAQSGFRAGVTPRAGVAPRACKADAGWDRIPRRGARSLRPSGPRARPPRRDRRPELRGACPRLRCAAVQYRVLRLTTVVDSDFFDAAAFGRRADCGAAYAALCPSRLCAVRFLTYIIVLKAVVCVLDFRVGHLVGKMATMSAHARVQSHISCPTIDRGRSRVQAAAAHTPTR